MKKETLEEASRQYACYNFDSSFLDIDDHYEAGAKWQAERMYSEEDLKHLEWIYDRIVNFHNENPNYDYILKFKSIIEKFKKK